MYVSSAVPGRKSGVGGGVHDTTPGYDSSDDCTSPAIMVRHYTLAPRRATLTTTAYLEQPPPELEVESPKIVH